jgi:hypothetical protein
MEKTRTFAEYRDELKERVHLRQMELESRLAELIAESSLHADAAPAARKEEEVIVKKLDEVKHTLGDDGWEAVDERAAKRLSEWLIVDA